MLHVLKTRHTSVVSKRLKVQTRQPQPNLNQFYFLPHVSDLMKSHHQAIKNTQRKIIEIQPIEIIYIFFSVAEISNWQKIGVVSTFRKNQVSAIGKIFWRVVFIYLFRVFSIACLRLFTKVETCSTKWNWYEFSFGWRLVLSSFSVTCHNGMSLTNTSYRLHAPVDVRRSYTRVINQMYAQNMYQPSHLQRISNTQVNTTPLDHLPFKTGVL